MHAAHPRFSHAILLAAVIYSLSWLLPNHHEPWVDFYSDVWAGLIMWFVAAVVFWKTRNSLTTELHILPALTLTCILVVWLQYAASLVEYFGVAVTGSLYLAGFAIALLTGAKWERWRPGECADFIFLAALLGATGSFFVQLQQWLRIDPGSAFWLFIPAPPRRFHANLGQANQTATLLCLGILGCAWLRERRWLADWLAWLWAACLGIGLALTESRTSWLVIATSLLLIIWWNKRKLFGKFLIAATAAWVCLFVLYVALLPTVNAWLKHASELQEIRNITAHDLRIEFWLKSWQAVLQRPWAGFGWMQTSHSQFALPTDEMITGGTLRHAHNLVLDLLIEFGVPWGLLVTAILGIWIIKTAMRVTKSEHAWMFLFVNALFIHALLEFPLHYAYFLLPLGLMMGALNHVAEFKPIQELKPWAGAVLLATASLGLVLIARDYLRIEEDFFALRFEKQQIATPREKSAPKIIFLDQLQDMIWLARVDPSIEHSTEDLSRAHRSATLLPSLMAKYKMASMYAFAGQPEQAKYWVTVMTRMNRLSRSEIAQLHEMWTEQSKSHPPMAAIIWPVY